MSAEYIHSSFPDKRMPVVDTSCKPFAAIARLGHFGTGFLSKIDDSYVIITAGHCLEGKANIDITLGDNPLTIFPMKIKAAKETFLLPPKYKKCKPTDYGIILLENQTYFRERGYFLDIAKWEAGKLLEMSGYPSDAKDKRTQMQIAVTDCTEDDVCPKLLKYRDATYKGNSGSPIYENRNQRFVAVGIHISGDKELKKNNGVKITEAVAKNMLKLVKDLKKRIAGAQASSPPEKTVIDKKSASITRSLKSESMSYSFVGSLFPLPSTAVGLGYQHDIDGKLYTALAYTKDGRVGGKATEDTCWYSHGGRVGFTKDFSWLTAPAGSVVPVHHSDIPPTNRISFGRESDNEEYFAALANCKFGHIPGKARGNTCWFRYDCKEHTTPNFFWLVEKLSSD